MGLSVDGFGDFTSVAWAKCENGKIKIIDRIYFPNSLGIFYEAITQLLQFNNYGDEYKVMGLSAYGKPFYVDNLQKLFIDIKYPILEKSYFNHLDKNFNYQFEGSPNQNKIFKDKINNLFDFD